MNTATAKQVGRLSDSYDKLISALSARQSKQAWNLWKSLTPSDWWNDGVTWGYAAKQASVDMARNLKARQLGEATAFKTLQALNAKTFDPISGSWIPSRANTDPQRIAMKHVDTYRHLTTLDPQVRPEEWPKPDEKDWQLVESWLRQARERLETVADTDTVRSGDMAMQESYKRAGVTQYRRVIHPELSKTGSCGICVVAATRIYKIRDLKAMHVECHCGIVPITDQDPGEYLNNIDLETIYRKAGGTSADQLRHLRIQVGTHGELGPILDEYNNLAEDQYSKTRYRNYPNKPSSWRPPDNKMAKQQLQAMLDRSDKLLESMKRVRKTGKEETLDTDGRRLRVAPSKSLKRAIDYQEAFARELRTMLHENV
ncbi:MAG: hypothetical protein J6575_03515 [Bifidobacterium sp.]|nr:hypothetical protein [Bifidobacterium sp.]